MTIQTLFPIPTNYLHSIRNIHYYFEFAVAVLSYILNTTIVWLALTRSTKHMKSYSWIIIGNACVDLFYNTVYIVSGSVSKNIIWKMVISITAIPLIAK